jgi:hypothetical protein
MSGDNDQAWDATRRGFLGVAAGLTGVALLQASSNEAEAQSRSFAVGHFALELDGVLIGLLKSVDGGDTSAEVVTEAPETYYSKKHISNLKYEDFEIQAGFSMAKNFYDWIASTLRGQSPRHDGAIDELDFRLNVVRSREFFDALITELTIPACDGSAKDPAYMTIKLSPELTRPRKGSSVRGAFGNTVQKMWLPANFRLKIDGLDTSRVNKIDAFTIKQTVVTNQVGEERDFAKEPTKLEFPNLVITFSETTAATWQAWFEDFVIKGNADDSKERTGTLEFLSPNRSEALASLTFFNMGIFRLAPDTPEPSGNGNAIRRMKAELYCERMEFNFKASPVA